MTKKGKKNGKGKPKFVPIDTFTEKNLTSGSSDGQKASKKSNNKDFNDDNTKTEKNPMSPTSDTFELSADVSTISNSTKGDESTDTSSKLCGQLDESILDDNKTDISYCSESGISYCNNHEPEVKNGNQNLSKSFHSDESFHKSPTKSNQTKEFDKRNRYDKRNESTNQGKFIDKGANYGGNSPHDISNSETQMVNVLAEKSTNTKQSKGKSSGASDYKNTERQNLAKENKNLDDDCENADSLNSMQAENRCNQNFLATNASDTENNQPKYREMGSFKDTPSTTDDYFEDTWKKSKANTQNWRTDSRKSFPAMSSHHENTSKRFSEGNKEDWKGSTKNRNYNDRYSESTDKEFKAFCDEERSKKKIEFVRVEEILQDLFAMPNEYSLAHCVAEDMRMGSGIAVTFKREFKQMDSLLDQRQKQGGLAVLEDEANEGTRYIYYLITKRESTGKPTYEKFWSSLQKMRNHIRDHSVKKLAIPRLGCGLDRLEWDRVKHMIEFLFKDVDVKITVCNFQQTEESPEKPVNYTCKVVNVAKAVADIEEETTIIYLSSEDGYVSTEMEELDKKFSFLNEFRRARKQLGDVIKYEVKNKYYILYGCIVRKTQKDPFNFKSFTKCLSQISKNNRKDKYIYVGIQAIKDDNDDLLMEKILSILKNYMSKVDIYVCWHGDLISKMPISSRDF